MLKNRTRSSVLGLISLFLVFFCMPSCETDDNELKKTDKVNVYNLSFDTHDSIPGLENVFFTIDQKEGKIFNQDSLPYRSNVTQLHPVFTFYDSPSSWIVNDTLEWNAKDSLDFSQPVKFTLWSSDKSTKKDYWITVNVHQVNPDAIVWKQLDAVYSSEFALEAMNKKTLLFNDQLWMYGISASKVILYHSEDNGLTWNVLPIKGLSAYCRLDRIVELNQKLYTFDSYGRIYTSLDGQNWEEQSHSLQGTLLSIIGKVNGKLSGIVKNNEGYLRFFTTSDFHSFDYSRQNVPLGFPFIYNATTNYTTRTGIETLVTGLGYGLEYTQYNNKFIFNGNYRTDVWSSILWTSTDGLNWANLTFEQSVNALSPSEWEKLKDKKTLFGKRLGSSLFASDNKLFFTGGYLQNSIDCMKDLYVSEDGGITWKKAANDLMWPDSYKARMNASIVIDENNYISIYGGGTLQTSYSDCWRGRINKLNLLD